MNYFKHTFILLLASMKTAVSSNAMVTSLRGNNNINNGSSRKLGERRQTKPCKVIAISDTPLSGNDFEDSFICELEPEDAGGLPGHSVSFEVSPGQIEVMRGMLADGEIISGVSTFMKSNALITSDEKLFIPSGIEISFERRPNGQRNLATVTGMKPVLAVRVTATDYDVEDSPAVISNKIFGTNGDPNNLASQLNACSMNQLTITTDYSVDITHLLDAPGVISVNIDIPLQGNSKGTIRNAITTAVENKLGFGIPGTVFQQVMYIIRGCYHTDCGWAAYAYINSWNSVYQGNYYKYTGVQVHEFGHNLNLAHSGMNGASYADHTCMMGNPLYSDNVGRMCYNPAKNWQIGWYDNNKLVINPRVTSFWRGYIVGIADYLNNPSNHPVVIKIETGTTLDHFIGFNRAKGANADNDLCDNCVTVIETGNNGEGYSQSWNKVGGTGGLVQGQEYRFNNWQGLGEDLVVFVHDINLVLNPGFADVAIRLGDGPISPPTSPPTKAPTSSPTPANLKTMWIACGKMGKCPEGFLSHAEQHEKHEVRCCSDTRKNGWVKKSWCDVWGESDLPGCYHSNTFLEAKLICEGVGARLCTLEELELGCTSGTGCNHDYDLVWSNTVYDSTESTGSLDSQHMTACSSSYELCAGETIAEDNSNRHEVRCCADNEVTDWAKNSNCDVWGESDIGGTCYHSNTYDEARLICKAHGGRLCTKEELLADCTQGSGCGHDSDMIWSSSLPPEHMIACGSTHTTCVGKAFTEDNNNTHEVRCCADNEVQGWAKNSNCDVWGESDIGGICYHSNTYDEARLICKTHGGRLCTHKELLASCTQGSGCGHDSDMIWSSSLPSSQHMIACGATYTVCAGQSFEEDDNNRHEVRCCADNEVQGWAKNSNCDVWGESDIGGTCYHSNTYNEARLICKLNGGRLCTKEELLAGCAEGSGCGHDSDMIWSSSLPSS